MRCLPEFRMGCIGSDLDQRFQHKAPLVHGWMRNRQTGLIDHAISEQHQVNINIARSLLALAETPHGRLDLQCRLEQFLRCLPGFDCGYAVEKPGLVGEVVRNIDRLGLIECGDGQQSSGYIQLREGGAQVGGTVSEVRSQG